MERVWKEISLISSLEDDQEAPGEEEQGEREMRLQDFLAGERRSRCSGVSSEIVGMSRSGTATAEGSAAAATSLLRLNSGCNDQMRDLDWLGGFEPTKDSSAPSSLHHHPQHSMVEGFGSFCRKRGVVLNGEDFVDRRQKRMTKNRESAARSRARKQAYTNELEIEIAHLVEENIKLKQEQNQLLQMEQQPTIGKTTSQYTKEKPILRRTSTAPF